MCHQHIDVNHAEAIPVAEHLDVESCSLLQCAPSPRRQLIDVDRWRTKIVKISLSMIGSGHNIFVDKHLSSWF